MVILTNVVKYSGKHGISKQVDEKEMMNRIQKMSSVKDLSLSLKNFFNVIVCDLRRHRAVLDTERVLKICKLL